MRGERRVQLESQADVEALAGCTDVEGGLFILGDDIVDLRPLADLRRVGGELQISDAESLTSVAGLEGLEEVGALGFGGNDSLETLDGLASLHVEVNLSVSDNASLTSIEGLSGVTLGEGYEGTFEIGIMRNPSLPSLAGAELVRVGGPWLNLQVSENDALVDLGALGDVEELGALRLSDNRLLESHSRLSRRSRGLPTSRSRSFRSRAFAGSKECEPCRKSASTATLRSPISLLCRRSRNWAR